MNDQRIEDSELFRRVAAEEKARRRPHATQPKSDKDIVQPLESSSAAIYAGMTPPDRGFLDEAGLIPSRNVTLLSGDGGTGKSLLALQLGIAVAAETPWIGISVASGAVFYLSCEEDQREVHKRLAEISAVDGIDLRDVANLEISYQAGNDATLAHEGRGGKLQTTSTYDRLVVALDLLRPALVIIDNLADVFAGNENNRSVVKHFVTLLRGLALRIDCTILVLAHPSLTGLNSGSGMSGSTAWSNSVRSRLYLHKDADANGYEADKSVRLLETMKANYGPRGQPIGLSWQNGRFIRRDLPKPFDDVTNADRERVEQLFRTGKYRVSERSEDWGGFVVAGVLDIDVGRGIGPAERTPTQNAARTRVRAILSTWTTNKAIRIEKRTDEHRKERDVYVA